MHAIPIFSQKKNKKVSHCCPMLCVHIYKHFHTYTYTHSNTYKANVINKNTDAQCLV